MHLDVRSCYSFHDGVAKPADICVQAKDLGFDSIGLADVNGTYGLINFYVAAQAVGIHPVLGVTLSALPAKGKAALEDRDPTQAVATVLARSNEGYAEICLLATMRQIDPHFSFVEALSRHTEHCFVLSDHRQLLESLAPLLGPRRLYVKVLPDYGKHYRARQIEQLKLTRALSLQPIACSDVRFLRPQDQSIHYVLRAIGQCATLQTACGVRPRQHYLSAPSELVGYYYDCPEALTNARKLAERCEAGFELDRWQFPQLRLPNGQPPDDALLTLCRRGLQWRYGSRAGDPKILERMEYELGVIRTLGFTNYFLFVYDIVREAAHRRMPCLGRGSAANSLVAYLLALTPVCPLEHHLYFERFMNPARKSPPDIDIDFPSDRRDEILRYVYERWGEHRVAMISTHKTLEGKSAFREVGKVFGLSDDELSKVTKMMPWMAARDLPTMTQTFPELAKLNLNEDPYRLFLPLAAKLDGIPQHLGIHCAGIIIAPSRTTDYTGVQRSANGMLVTQYDMYSIERTGLIKIDLLGNCGLQACNDTLAALEQRGFKPDLSDTRKLLADKKTRDIISSGGTLGCFYIESPAMLRLLKQLGTHTFDGLTIATSIIRPGVAQSGMMQEYLRRAKGEPPKMDIHPRMEELMPDTKGIMVFQEDVIKVVMELAGMSASDADILRRAMSGKRGGRSQMPKLHDSFINGCIERGLDLGAATAIWRQIASFSGYSFCKSHSAAFGVLSVQAAFLKAHFPADYMAAVLSHHGGFYSNHTYLTECRWLGLKVLPPDVNYSHVRYAAERTPSANGQPDAVRVGLCVIRNMTSSLKERIVRERLRGGQYRTLQEFIRRTKPGKADLDILIQCGALDSLGLSRPELQWIADVDHKAAMRGGSLPFDEAERAREFSTEVGCRLTDYSEDEKLRLEYEHFGMLVTKHPLELVPPIPGVVQAKDLHRQIGRRVSMLGWCIAAKRIDVQARSETKAALGQDPALLEEPDGHDFERPADDLGLITYGNSWVSNGQPMKFMSMCDLSGTYEVTLFPRVYKRVAHLTKFQGPYLVTGKVEDDFGVCSVNCSGLELLSF
jgi:DNA-directed DNA polymerase III PolC